jgi:5-formyltetrahydrofolate cyclo-ligase
MVVPPTSSKAELRAELRAARRVFAEGLAFLVDEALLVPLRAVIAQSQCVAGYWPVGGEPDVRQIIEETANQGLATALPRIDPVSGKMSFRLWRPLDQTERLQGFQQPLASAPCTQPDLILAPLVGFDRALNRLGQGGGHYDRAFAAYPQAYKIGIAWSIQEIRRVPTEPHDIQLDAILTEKEWITQ